MSLPRVWLVPGGRNWAYDFTARALVQHLSHRFEIRLAYTDDLHGLNRWGDLIVDFWWRGGLERRFGHRVVKQVSSHRWHGPKHHAITTRTMARKYLAPSGGIVVPSVRLYDELAAIQVRKKKRELPVALPRISLCPKGFHPELMGDYGWRRGPLRTGWAGKASAPDKHIEIVLAADPDIRIADQCLTQSEMGDFYNLVDVITCASDAEGDPRPIIEGMACGAFPVTVDVGIVPELVRHGDNGLIVERTPQAFAAAFAWCREHIDHVRAAGRRNALEMARDRTWAHTSVAWGDAFDVALERMARRSPGRRERKLERERLKVDA